jgi:hypothetical protein
LLYFSRWDSPEAAKAFAQLYAEYLPKRYKKASQYPAACPVATGDTYRCSAKLWDTEQGKVRIEVQGSDLLIMEDFDDLTVEKARDVLFYHMSLPAKETKEAKAAAHK